MRKGLISVGAALALALPALGVTAVEAHNCHDKGCHHEKHHDHDRHADDGSSRNGNDQHREGDGCRGVVTACGDSFDRILIEVGRALGPHPVP
jgi:hypothetical protein